MTLEKVFYGVLLTLAITFGGLVYNGAINRILILEAHAQELDRQATVNAVSLSELKWEIKYLRSEVERLQAQTLVIEQKLDHVLRTLKGR